MKKNKWIIYLLIILIGIAVLSPPLFGLFVKRQYLKTIDSYNSLGTIHVEIKSYERGWWSSHSILLIHVDKHGISDILNLPANFVFEIDQEVQHGPVFYMSGKEFPVFVGLSQIRSTFAVLIDEHLLSILGATSYGSFKHGNSQLAINREVDVNQLQIDNEVFGPLRFIFDAEKLNENAINGIMSAYQVYFDQGEVYQGQLRGKLLLLIPQIFNPGSTLSLKSLTVKTSQGVLQGSGKIIWPSNSPSVPDDIEDFLHNATITLSLRTSEALADELIRYASTLPYFQDFSQEEKQQLLELQNNIDIAYQQNNLLLAELMYLRIISNNNGNQLLLLSRDHELADRYLANIKTHFLNKEIPPETAYLLYWQFSQLQRQVDSFEKQLDQHQDDVRKSLLLWLQDWVKQGYVTHDHHDYRVDMMRENGVLKLNGKILKNLD